MPSHFKFKEYCPIVFRNLRERFNVDEDNFMVSTTFFSWLENVHKWDKSVWKVFSKMFTLYFCLQLSIFVFLVEFVDEDGADGHGFPRTKWLPVSHVIWQTVRCQNDFQRRSRRNAPHTQGLPSGIARLLFHAPTVNPAIHTGLFNRPWLSGQHSTVKLTGQGIPMKWCN